MRKLFSLIAAVLFAGSMMATEVVFTNADFAGQGTANTGSEVTATKDGVTFTYSKGYSAEESLRCYAHGALTISAESTIEKINFTTTGGKTGGLDAEVTVGATSYSVEDLASQARFTEIVVTLGGGDDPVLGAWNEIKFTEAVTADALPADSIFKSDKEGFQAQIADAGNKMSIDANPCRFGTAEDYGMSNFRLKSGGASSADKNFITVSVPTDGKLRVAVRTSSATADDRALYLIQGDTLYNDIIQESMAIEVTENEQTVKVYPFVEVPVKAGNVIVRYNAGLNFYAFGFNSTTTPVVEPDTLSCAEAAAAAAQGVTDEVIIKGYVTEMVEEWSSYKNVSFWMSDAQGGENTFEAFRVKCETAADAPGVGDLVWVKGNLTYYTKDSVTYTPETKTGGSFGIIEKGERPEPQNLGEKTIAEFLALKNTVDTCILTGAIDSLVNASYGNFNLVDETGKVYVYGLKDAEGNYCYEAKGLQVGDIITVLAIYSEYKGAPQVKNAIFVSKKSQGIDNTGVEVKVEKFFRNGQLIIRKNGVEYNAQGAIVR